MDLSTRTLTLLALIAIGLSVLAIVFSMIGSGARRVETASSIPTDQTVGVLLARIERLEKAARTLNAIDKRQQLQVEASVRRVGLLRYDAFEDVGGRLSFSCALLDEHGNGVVLTSINGRQETRVYAKPVTAGTSSYNLSSEEGEAIRQAMADAHEAATAG
ncbi:MAG TPA: DUF4446 family protein [Actinomycetota bacterium]|jgi:hypothetical protein